VWARSAPGLGVTSWLCMEEMLMCLNYWLLEKNALCTTETFDPASASVCMHSKTVVVKATVC
jgi:hypothetical protein